MGRFPKRLGSFHFLGRYLNGQRTPQGLMDLTSLRGPEARSKKANCACRFSSLVCGNTRHLTSLVTSVAHVNYHIPNRDVKQFLLEKWSRP